MAENYARFDAVLATLINGILIPDRREHGFLIGWGDVIVGMRRDRTVYAWGPYLLGILYHQLHEVAYRRAESISCGTTLLMIWAWEHIAIFYLPIQRPQLVEGIPYAYYYAGALQQTWMGEKSWWHHQIDTMVSFIWRSYRDYQQWDDEVDHFSLCRQYRCLIGRTLQSQLIIEMYLP